MDHTPNRIELKDVKGNTYIQIHNGNYPEDSNGCFLAGKTHATDFVGSSNDAMKQILGIVERNGSYEIKVRVRWFGDEIW